MKHQQFRSDVSEGGINRKWQRNPRITSEEYRNHVKLRTNNNCVGVHTYSFIITLVLIEFYYNTFIASGRYTLGIRRQQEIFIL